MKPRTLQIEGKTYVTVETVAGCLQCETQWVLEVYEQGLLGEGVRRDNTVAIAARMMDRMVTIQRFNKDLGIALSAIAAVLDLED